MRDGIRSRSSRWGLLLAVWLVVVLSGDIARAQQQLPAAQDSKLDWEGVPQAESEWLSETMSESDELASCPEQPHRGLLPRHPFRYLGIGEPLVGTSWLNRPYYVGAFGGTWGGDTLIAGSAEQESGFFGGYWLGKDLNHYWGSELRASLFYVNTILDRGTRVVESRNVVGDVNLLYYPWGDSRWRPYGSIGVGFAGFHYVNAGDLAIDHTGPSLPIGLGIKYLCHNWLAFRLDLKDNIVFGGNGINATNNWSIVAGAEVHWGSKSSVRYFPW